MSLDARPSDAELLARVGGIRVGPNSPLLKPRRARSKDREHQEQVKVFAWAELAANKYSVLHFMFAVPNWFGVRTIRHGARAKAEGRKPGVPDIWLPVARGGYHGLVIEMKSGRERLPTHAQRQWLAFLEHAGWKTSIAYSAEEAIAVITDYLKAA